MQFIIDSPLASSLQYRHGFTVEGWAYAPQSSPTHVAAAIDNVEVGRSSIFFKRADVAAALEISAETHCGFRFSCATPTTFEKSGNAEICITLYSGNEILSTKRRNIRFADTDYRALPFGAMLNAETTWYLRRAQVYAEGLPSAISSDEAVALLLRYLRTGEAVIDVGCGIGAYAEPLLAHGIDWHGCETRLDYCEAVAQRGLPCRAVTNGRLPFESNEFSAAIAIEVLEHVLDIDQFISEIARISEHAAYFSVPNMETLPVYWTYYAVPWHMLIPDHENFFNRFALKSVLERHFRTVEIFEYGRIESITSKEGLPLLNHLFAVALH
jgi:2-polyprenyl-3-methyl-5-hydroxy-6-metoxy-1,4-benzoquinol methylase